MPVPHWMPLIKLDIKFSWTSDKLDAISWQIHETMAKLGGKVQRKGSALFQPECCMEFTNYARWINTVKRTRTTQ